jgi:transcriptional regulator with XRE-family HTH domain
MTLHEELRRAREEAGLTQTQLAALTGIPRNQIARAERGENITLDTLRKIVVHLPIRELSLLETVKLTVDYFPEPEKLLSGMVETVQKLAAAMTVAVQTAADARMALRQARKEAEPLPGVDDQRDADIDPGELLRKLEQLAKELEAFPKSETT